MTIELISDALSRIVAHEHRAASTLNMVPSENGMSGLAKLPMLLDLYQRYFFNDGPDDEPWEFRGVQELGFLETGLASSLLQELGSARYVNMRALSGLNLMTTILAGLGGPAGSAVMLLARAQGGHYATATVAERLGLNVCYATGKDAHSIDDASVAKTLEQHQPGLVYIDQSNALFPLDVERLARVIGEAAPRAILHVDASHWLGLILGRQLPNPLAAGAHSFGGSTHKTFPGPHKGVFLTNHLELATKLKAAQHYLVSNHNFGATVSLALALIEFKHWGGERYCAQLVRNVHVLGAELARCGFALDGKDGKHSAGHQLWVRTSVMGVDAFVASDRLFEVGIRTNAYPFLPGIAEPVLRLGVNEPTYRGLVDRDMTEVAEIFRGAILQTAPPAALRERVAALRARYRSAFGVPLDNPDLLEKAMQLVHSVLARPMRPGPESGVEPNSGRSESAKLAMLRAPDLENVGLINRAHAARCEGTG